jgi:predicted nuclease of predicted toxin-antitoxin system
MRYRLLCDENIEQATVNYLRKLGHDVERVPEVSALNEGDPDERLAEYSRETDRLVLTQDDDFLTDIDPTDTAGVLAQRDQELSARQVGDIVEEMATYISQDQVTVEYVTEQWL